MHAAVKNLSYLGLTLALTGGALSGVPLRADAAQDGRVQEIGFPCLAEVTGDTVRVRTGPSLNHFAFTLLPLRSRLVAQALEGSEQEWVQVALPPYVPVWIHSDYLQARGDGTFVVTGSRIRVRSTPGTQHEPIGMANRDEVVHGTGQRDASGAWIQVQAPPGTRAYLHRDFLQLGEPVPASQVNLIVRGLTAARPIDPEVAQGTPPTVDPEALPRLGRVSPRLQQVHQSYLAEKQKTPRDWDFATVLAELGRIARTSEDLGEVENAERWQKWIQEHLLPIREQLLELDRQRELARRTEDESKRETEDEIKRAVHRVPPQDGEAGYLATGWIVPIGKHRQVDATHKLMKGNQLLFYLRSDQVDLDAFVNRMVGIQGTKRELPPESGALLVLVTSLQNLSR